MEALSTLTICRLSDSHRHQLSAIALGFAGHAPVGATANSELTFYPDHSMGADHFIHMSVFAHVVLIVLLAKAMFYVIL